jgi:hypothetical protein
LSTQIDKKEQEDRHAFLLGGSIPLWGSYYFNQTTLYTISVTILKKPVKNHHQHVTILISVSLF